MKLTKFLAYVVLGLVLFGLLTLKSQCENAVKWDDSAKYTYMERDEIILSLEHRFGEKAAETVEKALGKSMNEATTQELRDYLRHLEKDFYPMESIAKEHEEMTDAQQASRLGRIGLFVIGLLAFVKLLQHKKLGDKYRILRLLKKFDIGFKKPDKDGK